MCEKRCLACRRFKDLSNYKNNGISSITKPYYKLCSECRERARGYQASYKASGKIPMRKYNKRDVEYREPLEQDLACYEVEPYIMYDPNYMVCVINPGDLLLFVGDRHLTDFNFQTLDEAREFRDWVFGIFNGQNLNQLF